MNLNFRNFSTDLFQVYASLFSPAMKMPELNQKSSETRNPGKFNISIFWRVGRTLTRYFSTELSGRDPGIKRPYIQICPCNEKCKQNLFIDVVDDECSNESSQNFMESITASYSEKRNYVQSKMKFMFNNEEGLAQTSEILLQNCYRKDFTDQLGPYT